MTENIELLRQADQCLSRCGRNLAPQGLRSVDVYAGLFYQTVVANQSTQEQPLEITGDTTFVMKAISAIQAPVLAYVQIQFPNKMFLQQSLRQLNQNCGVGSNRYVLDREIVCAPETKILITGDTSISNPGSAQPFSLLFEGAYRYYLKPSSKLPERIVPAALAASLPRIYSTRNQNPMAPRWMSAEFDLAGAEWYTYAQSPSATFAVPSAGGGSNNRVVIPTEMGYEFFLRRFYGLATLDAGTTGTPYVRIREGSGRELTDDYVNLANIGQQAMGDWWRIPNGRDIIVDLIVVDSTGPGNITVQWFFEGMRRRT